MRIIGFNLSKIQVQRKENFEGSLEVNQNIDIKEITQKKVSVSKDEVLEITFNFTINYSHEFAKIEFEGALLALPSKEELEEIMKLWKSKEISDTVRIFLFNFIMNKCNIKALALEDEMNLPFHIPMPKFNKKES